MLKMLETVARLLEVVLIGGSVWFLYQVGLVIGTWPMWTGF